MSAHVDGEPGGNADDRDERLAVRPPAVKNAACGFILSEVFAQSGARPGDRPALAMAVLCTVPPACSWWRTVRSRRRWVRVRSSTGARVTLTIGSGRSPRAAAMDGQCSSSRALWHHASAARGLRSRGEPHIRGVGQWLGREATPPGELRIADCGLRIVESPVPLRWRKTWPAAGARPQVSSIWDPPARASARSSAAGANRTNQRVAPIAARLIDRVNRRRGAAGVSL